MEQPNGLFALDRECFRVPVTPPRLSLSYAQYFQRPWLASAQEAVTLNLNRTISSASSLQLQCDRPYSKGDRQSFSFLYRNLRLLENRVGGTQMPQYRSFWRMLSSCMVKMSIDNFRQSEARNFAMGTRSADLPLNGDSVFKSCRTCLPTYLLLVQSEFTPA